MSTNNTSAKVILLVTDDELLEAKITTSLDELKDAVMAFPEVQLFMPPKLEHSVFLAEARERLNPASPNAIAPVLIIFDPFVRESDQQRIPSDSKLAIEFLKHLADTLPDIPVLVVAPAPAEDVQRKVLGRRMTSLWLLKPEDPDENAFAEALAGLALANRTAHQRYTITVGHDTARYSVFNDRYKIAASTEIAYDDPEAIDNLLSAVDTFSFREGRGGADYVKTTFFFWGSSLYELLIKDTVGPHILPVLRGGNAGKSRPKLDLRFEIEVGTAEREKLFGLPFEFVNASSLKTFLCSRVPMARLINLGHQHHAKAATMRADADDYRVLFMKSNVSKTVSVRLESGRILREYGFSKLRSIDKELATLQDCTQPGGQRRGKVDRTIIPASCKS